MRAFVCGAALAIGCAAAPARPTAARHRRASGAADVTPAGAEAEFRATLERAGAQEARATLSEWGVALRRAQGARSLSGDPAPDDAVSSVTPVTVIGRSAAAVVQTACGNAAVVGFAWRDGRWAAVDRAALVDDARPGACRETTVAVDARAVESAEVRDILAVTTSASEEGDEVRDPELRVFHLGRDGALAPRSAGIPIGDEDPAAGTTRRGAWIVEEALPAPRDIYVELTPGRRGPGGATPRREIVRVTYRLRDGRYTAVDEERVEFRDRAPPPRIAVPLDRE
ncbi:MAG: hypothetical protein R3A52_22040 [Polyangiales bacterium]